MSFRVAWAIQQNCLKKKIYEKKVEIAGLFCFSKCSKPIFKIPPSNLLLFLELQVFSGYFLF
jgi:hypothetical protein